MRPYGYLRFSQSAYHALKHLISLHPAGFTGYTELCNLRDEMEYQLSRPDDLARSNYCEAATALYSPTPGDSQCLEFFQDESIIELTPNGAWVMGFAFVPNTTLPPIAP